MCSDIILPPSSKCHRVSQSFVLFKVPHHEFVWFLCIYVSNFPSSLMSLSVYCVIKNTTYEVVCCAVLSSLLSFTHLHTSNVFLALPIKIFWHNSILHLEYSRQFQCKAYTYFGMHIERALLYIWNAHFLHNSHRQQFIRFEETNKDIWGNASQFLDY